MSMAKVIKDNMRIDPRSCVIVDYDGMSDEEWNNYRKTGIGGSDVSAILGCNPYKTARDLYNTKAGIPITEEPQSEASMIACERGKLLEPLVARLIANRYGLELQEDTTMYKHPNLGLYFLIANIDYMATSSDNKPILIECKTARTEKKVEWEDGKIPIYYEWQVRHYLNILYEICGCEKAYIGCLFDDGTFISREIIRDPLLEYEIIDKCKDFWDDVLAKKPPEYTDGNLALKELAARVSAPSKTIIELPGNTESELEEIYNLYSLKSAAAKAAADAENAYKLAFATFVDKHLGNAEAGELEAGGYKYKISRKRYDRGGIDTERLKCAFPDVYNRVCKPKDYTFRTSFSRKDIVAKKAV